MSAGPTRPDDTSTVAITGVELSCDAAGALFLHAHCHPTTPLRARTEGDVLILSCAQPTCRRDVARVYLAPEWGPRCPYCGEDVLVEVDAARAICFVCARTWVPEPPS